MIRKHKSYWRGKTRQHLYARLIKSGAPKHSAQKYSVSRFHFAMYGEMRAIEMDFKYALNYAIWGEPGTSTTRLTGLSGIVNLSGELFV